MTFNAQAAEGVSVAAERPAETERIWRTHDHFIVCYGGQKTIKYLHLPTEHGKRCKTTATGEQDWRIKSTSVYPVGYKPICRRCLALWRRERE